MTEIERLKEEIERLAAENNRLKSLLASHGIPWQLPKTEDIAAEKERRIRLFMKLFCARRDFYAERWEGRDGRKGYAPACSNRWKPVCPKKTQKGIKCHECKEHAWIPFTEDTAYCHLTGKDTRGKPFVAGTYALLEDSTCNGADFMEGQHLPICRTASSRLCRKGKRGDLRLCGCPCKNVGTNVSTEQQFRTDLHCKPAMI